MKGSTAECIPNPSHGRGVYVCISTSCPLNDIRVCDSMYRLRVCEAPDLYSRLSKSEKVLLPPILMSGREAERTVGSGQVSLQATEIQPCCQASKVERTMRNSKVSLQSDPSPALLPSLKGGKNDAKLKGFPSVRPNSCLACQASKAERTMRNSKVSLQSDPSLALLPSLKG